MDDINKTPVTAIWTQTLELGYESGNSSTAVRLGSNATKPICFHCGKSDVAKLSKCARCKVVGYCSKECQVQDWKAISKGGGGHKSACAAYARLEVVHQNKNINSNNSQENNQDESYNCHNQQDSDPAVPGSSSTNANVNSLATGATFFENDNDRHSQQYDRENSNNHQHKDHHHPYDSITSQLRILCLHDVNSSASLLKKSLDILGDRLYEKHGIDLVYVNSPLCAGDVDGQTDRVWYETHTETRTKMSSETSNTAADNSNIQQEQQQQQQKDKLVGLDASLCLLQQMWASMPFWGILGIGQGAAVGSLFSLLPNVKPRAKFGIFIQGGALIQEAELLVDADDWSCLHIFDPDIQSGSEEKLVQQFGGTVHRINRKGGDAYSKKVMNIIGKFIIEQKKKTRQEGESRALALRNQLYFAEQEASQLIAQRIAENPPSVLMAVVAPKAVFVGDMKRRAPNEEGGGAPFPNNINNSRMMYSVQVKSDHDKEQIRNELFGRIRIYACSYAVYRTATLGKGFLFLQSDSTLATLSTPFPKDALGHPIRTMRAILMHFLTLGEYDKEVCREDFELSLVRNNLQQAVNEYDEQKEVVLLMRFRDGHVSLGRAQLVLDFGVCKTLGRQYFEENANSAVQLNLDDL